MNWDRAWEQHKHKRKPTHFKTFRCTFETLVLMFNGITKPTIEMEEQVLAIEKGWA